jgi:acyl-homoserine lactone acylase PvdQ
VGRLRRGLGLTALALLAPVVLVPVAHADPVQPYQQNDYGNGGFHNILPPGQCRDVTASEILSYQLDHSQVPGVCNNQKSMYEDLVYATPGLQASQIDNYFKDESFGAKPADVQRTYSPHPGVTVIRDNFNVPHVYGDNRPDLMFGAGYVGAEDRLFFMDALRHAGRGQLSSFAGGANKGMDADVWANSPYTEADLQKQIDLADDVYGADGVQLQQDLANYVAGINQYISEAYTDPNKMPGEYSLIGKPLLPWKGTDVIATAALVGGIFGKGGGGELTNSAVFNSAVSKFGTGAGTNVWQDFREANDPEAPTTVHGTSFPYETRTGIDPASVAIPDQGSIIDTSGGSPSAGGLLGGLGGLLGMSNALLVSANESQSGHPVTVFGPQVSYFAPQILMEEDLHAPDFDARGTAFVGVNLFVLLGRGQDFAWSATSAGQDIIDTFAEKLCNSDGSPPTIDSQGYLWKGECRPIETLERVNVITPNPADPSPPSVQTLKTQRTVHGVITKRGTVGGVPVAFAKLRSTYFHEADSARGFADFNTPSKVHDVKSFQDAASKIGFTFNWFYTDNKDIGYFNSGDNPVRANGTDPEFPSWGTGQWDWKGWNPDLNIAQYTPFDEHPQVVNQAYLTSWNNKQAPGFRAADDNYAYGPIYRSLSLDHEVQSRIAGNAKVDLPGLIDAMEEAGTTDLRGTQVLPYMLRVIRQGPGGVPGDLQASVDALQLWSDQGAHRRDADHNNQYDRWGEVKTMDAWWPLALDATFKPTLGDDLFNNLKGAIGFDDIPREQGSAYQKGWYGFMQKDLRDLLGDPVTGPYSRIYCGGGSLATCHDELVDSLRAAVATPYASLYPGTGGSAPGCLDGGGGDAQMCHDAVHFQAVGGVGVNDIHWINRPTFQQAVELFNHRPRSDTGNATPTKKPKKKCKKNKRIKNKRLQKKKLKRCKKKQKRKAKA